MITYHYTGLGPGWVGSRVTHQFQNVGRVGLGQSLCGSGRVQKMTNSGVEKADLGGAMSASCTAGPTVSTT